MSHTALLVGANRGIGINLARALALHEWNVIASIRPQTREAGDPSVKEIETIASDVLDIDLSNERTIMEAARHFGDGPLDMLVNIAGIGPEPDNWHEHTTQILMEKYAINTVVDTILRSSLPRRWSRTDSRVPQGPFLVSEYFYPNLKKAGGTIINISSNAGSITTCKGEDLGYRMSKAALNMMTVTMAKEFQMNGDNISVVALNPGYVATRLTNFRSRDDMDECIAGIVKVLEKVGMNETGTFLDWRGETLPW